MYARELWIDRDREQTTGGAQHSAERDCRFPEQSSIAHDTDAAGRFRNEQSAVRREREIARQIDRSLRLRQSAQGAA